MTYLPKKAAVYVATKLPEDNGFSEFAFDIEVGTRIFIEDVIPFDEEDSTEADGLVLVALGSEAGKYDDMGQELDAEEWSRFCQLYGLIEDTRKTR